MWGSKFPGAGEKVKVSPAFLGAVMLTDSLFLAELDMRLSIFVWMKGQCAIFLKWLKFAGYSRRFKESWQNGRRQNR